MSKGNSIFSKSLLSGFIMTFGLLLSCNSDVTEITTNAGIVEISTEELLQTMGEAYAFGYPMVMMDFTKRFSTNIAEPHPTRPLAPVNQLGHFRMFPDHTLTAVVKPNVDTYYSIAWLDLSEGPQVLTVPATNRYYLLPFMDSYSNVFFSPGTRTTGMGAHRFVLTGPFWEGEIPEGLEQIEAPTNMVWMLGRVQVNSPEDGATLVKDFQDGMRLVPLSDYENENYKAPTGIVREENASIIPSKTIQTLDVHSFFNKLTLLMKENPPAEADSTIIRKMERIGIVAGKEFNFSSDNFILNTKLKALPKFIHKKMNERRSVPDPNFLENGWMTVKENIGKYNVDYTRRAFISYIALGANLPEDAIYPNATLDVNGNSLDASSKYKLHFDQAQLPPVNAFWSMTAYNADEFLVKNEINRYALTDRDELSYNEDGSLDIYIQHERLSGPAFTNWLPIPEAGPFSLTMRLYWPKEEVFSGEWKMPAIIPVEE